LYADMESFARTRGRPPRMNALPRYFPLSSGCGATPASEAICLSSRRPNSV
jgi:hypothetical protein